MSEIKTQWKKRVNVMQMIYTYLINPIKKTDYLELCMKDFDCDADQLKVVEYFLEHKKEIKDVVNANTKETWNFDRLNTVEQAIIICAFSESAVLKTDRSILINESVKTAHNFCDENSYEFINALLDKILQ